MHPSAFLVSLLMLSLSAFAAPIASSANVAPALSDAAETPQLVGENAEYLKKRVWTEGTTYSEHMAKLANTPPPWNKPPPPEPAYAKAWYEHFEVTDRPAAKGQPAQQGNAISDWLFDGKPGTSAPWS